MDSPDRDSQGACDPGTHIFVKEVYATKKSAFLPSLYVDTCTLTLRVGATTTVY